MSIAEKLTTIAENEQKVYDAGRTKEWSDFWDTFQQNGNRTNYVSAFAGGYQQTAYATCWDDNNFRPKYDIYIGANTFNRCSVTNLKQRLIDCGVKIANNSESLYYACYASKITHIPDISTTAVTNLQNAFNGCFGLVSIDGINLASNCTCQNAFFNCSKLQHVIITGTIGTSGFSISVADSLDKESITSIINALSETTTGLTVTLPKTAVNKAFGIDVDDETTFPEGSEYYELRNSKSNWTISYA